MTSAHLRKYILQPPNRVKGIMELDKNLFEKPIDLPYLAINMHAFNGLRRILSKYLLKLPKYKSVQQINSTELMEVQLNPELVGQWDDIHIDDRKKLGQACVNMDSFHVKPFTLKFDHYSLNSVLQAVLSSNDAEGLSSYTSVGHIIHVNLKDHLLPYKKVIGEMILDKVAYCRTVVNKINCISSVYREFQIELLAGENNMITVVNENKLSFEFDFSKVYWNSRLSGERERIMEFLNSNDILFDTCAGVGPFALQAAYKNCKVFANDLNPEAIKWLHHNIKMNKLPRSKVTVYNYDASKFICDVFKTEVLQYMNSGEHPIYVLINLPASGVEFLKYFVGLFDRNQLQTVKKYPIVIVYCFVKGKCDVEQNCIEQVCDSFGFDIRDKIISVFNVRTVSNLKYMMRVMFTIDEHILSATKGIKRTLDSLDSGLCKKLEPS